MSYTVHFKKRVTDVEHYSLGSYETEVEASVVAKGEYYYRGGCTPTYDIFETDEKTQKIPEYLFDTLVSVVGFLSSEEQEVFREQHLNYLIKSGLLYT